MNAESPLKGKRILVVDDEPDILTTVAEILDMCSVDKASDFETGLQLIMNNTYDVVILDIMGVNGFELLKNTVSRGFPTVMLTAHAATPEALKKSIELGAASFLPKEEMTDLPGLIEEVVRGGGKRLWWLKSLQKTGPYFDRSFGPDWKEKDKFFRDFEESLREKQS
ncbi:MAG: response regulator [Deltaproteobacteria bacterium]|nr:response regulator [Deltaproteobacteria bacterium]